ncbi:MAG TPA: hypothetical protein VGW75_03180 [Solirubrobacteraceae bacterium]|nr:hypothetical protein [Solirubrobacteraceae bacterium]
MTQLDGVQLPDVYSPARVAGKVSTTRLAGEMSAFKHRGAQRARRDRLTARDLPKALLMLFIEFGVFP